jgi:hypothetical protein
MPLALGAGPNPVKSLPATIMAGALVSRKRIRALDRPPLPIQCLSSVLSSVHCPHLVAAHTAQTATLTPPLRRHGSAPSQRPLPGFALASTPNALVTDLRGIPYHAPLERIALLTRLRHHQPSPALVGPSDAFAPKAEMTTQVMPFRLDNLRAPQHQHQHQHRLHGAYARRVPKNCLHVASMAQGPSGTGPLVPILTTRSDTSRLHCRHKSCCSAARRSAADWWFGTGRVTQGAIPRLSVANKRCWQRR